MPGCICGGGYCPDVKSTVHFRTRTAFRGALLLAGSVRSGDFQSRFAIASLAEGNLKSCVREQHSAI